MGVLFSTLFGSLLGNKEVHVPSLHVASTSIVSFVACTSMWFVSRKHHLGTFSSEISRISYLLTTFSRAAAPGPEPAGLRNGTQLYEITAESKC